MSVIIQQATARQVKALAKRLQTVIPQVLGAAPISLHQAQAIVARGLGHADFHAAQQFHHGVGTPVPAAVFVGPPTYMIEVLMQRLGHHHSPTWPYWTERRALITAAVQTAWMNSSGASLTAAQIKEALTLAAVMSWSEAWGHASAKAYAKHVRAMGGSPSEGPLTETSQELHGVSAMDWIKVLRDSAAPSPDQSPLDQAFSALGAWMKVPHLHSETLRGSVEEVIHQLSQEITSASSPHEKDANMWVGRAIGLMCAAVRGLMSVLPPSVTLTRAHVLESMDLSRLYLLAHDQSTVPPSQKEMLRFYLHSVPGYHPVFSGESPRELSPSESVLDLHAYVVMQWIPHLRRFTIT